MYINNGSANIQNRNGQAMVHKNTTQKAIDWATRIAVKKTGVNSGAPEG